jgi:hypothetical protein
MYVSQLIASAHSLYGNDFAFSMQDAISFRDMFFRSATPFCCEYMELYDATESLSHGKDDGSHD